MFPTGSSEDELFIVQSTDRKMTQSFSSFHINMKQSAPAVGKPLINILMFSTCLFPQEVPEHPGLCAVRSDGEGAAGQRGRGEERGACGDTAQR